MAREFLRSYRILNLCIVPQAPHGDTVHPFASTPIFPNCETHNFALAFAQPESIVGPVASDSCGRIVEPRPSSDCLCCGDSEEVYSSAMIFSSGSPSVSSIEREARVLERRMSKRGGVEVVSMRMYFTVGSVAACGNRKMEDGIRWLLTARGKRAV